MSCNSINSRVYYMYININELSRLSCPVVIPSPCPSVLLSSCPHVLLSSRPFKLMSSCPIVLLAYGPIILLSSCLLPPCPHVPLASCPPVILSYCPSVSLTMEKNTRMKGTGDTTSNRIGIGFNHARTITNASADGLDK